MARADFDLYKQIVTIYMDEAHIQRACYDWLAARGLEPQALHKMTIGRGRDLVFPATGERRERFELSFPCSEPSGAICWDEAGRARVQASREELLAPASQAVRS